MGGHSHSLSSNRSASSVGGGAGKSGVGILDHCMTCANCSREIIGVRYQCASCPAPKMQSYNLVSGTLSLILFGILIMIRYY